MTRDSILDDDLRIGMRRYGSEVPLKARDELPLAARRFDELPDSALVDVRTVAILLGVSVATVWRRSARDILQRPNRAPGTNTTRWRVGDIRTAMKREPAREAR